MRIQSFHNELFTTSLILLFLVNGICIDGCESEQLSEIYLWVFFKNKKAFNIQKNDDADDV